MFIYNKAYFLSSVEIIYYRYYNNIITVILSRVTG